MNGASTGMLTPFGVGGAAAIAGTGTSSSVRTTAISSQLSFFGQRTQSLQTFSGSVSFVTTSKPIFYKNRCS
jgi:hypothetical protein